jgi:16S rRNA (guanine966-N2)-methyltransferase
VRVITGEAKGRKLKGPFDIKTRPMQDKIKEALFSSLESVGTNVDRVLDLYAGTGAIGIEALSRGGGWADFVDVGKGPCAVIKWNLEHTKLANRAKVHQIPVPVFLTTRREPYDLVILDPPYADPAITETMKMLVESQLVESGSKVALGHWPRFDLSTVDSRLKMVRSRCHGDSCFSIFEVALDRNGDT